MAPTVLDAVLPNWISKDSVFYFEFYTDVFEEALSGASVRNAMWSDFRLAGDLSSAIAIKEVFDTIRNLFLVCKGRLYGFKLQHPLEYTATSEAIGTGDGTSQDFQLVKNYTFGAYSHQHTISKPESGTVTVYFDDVPQPSGWTMDYDTGLLTASPGVGVVVTVDFQYYFPVRFDTDKLATQWEKYIAGTAKLPIVEVR